MPRQESEYELLSGLWRLKCGKSEQERDYGFTTTEERKVNNVKALIRESKWYLLALFALFRQTLNIIPIALLLFR